MALNAFAVPNATTFHATDQPLEACVTTCAGVMMSATTNESANFAVKLTALDFAQVRSADAGTKAHQVGCGLSGCVDSLVLSSATLNARIGVSLPHPNNNWSRNEKQTCRPE